MIPERRVMLERVVIARPGGNDTAIVFDPVPRSAQPSLSLKIQKAYPSIEQVMFVEKGTREKFRGQMAGGEFCGNAMRSLGFVLRDGKPGVQTLEASGASAPLQVYVSEEGAKTSIPVRPEFSCIRRNAETGEYIVEMEGISFLVTTPEQICGREILSFADECAKKSFVQRTLEEKGLSDRPASGIIVAQKREGDIYRIDPFVFVRDTGTIYYESGCGSGSAALGSIIAFESGKTLEKMKVLQPSGICLHCLH